MSLKAIEEILKEDWQKEAEIRNDRLHRLLDRISNLSEEDIALLVELYLDCTEQPLPTPIEIYEMAQKVKYGSTDISNKGELSKIALADFLHALMLAEYRLDDLLYHPPIMRMAEMDQYAKSVDLNREDFRRIYINWHSRFRKRIFAELCY